MGSYHSKNQDQESQISKPIEPLTQNNKMSIELCVGTKEEYSSSRGKKFSSKPVKIHGYQLEMQVTWLQAVLICISEPPEDPLGTVPPSYCLQGLTCRLLSCGYQREEINPINPKRGSYPLKKGGRINFNDVDDLIKEYEEDCRYNRYKGRDVLLLKIEFEVGLVQEDPDLELARTGRDLSWGVLRDLCDLLESGKHSDLIIESKDGTKFPVHRLVLSTRSAVFDAMISGGYQEGHEELIRLRDLSTPALEVLIQFLYVGDISKKIRYVEEGDKLLDTLVELLDAGERYDFPGLKNCAVAAIKMKCNTKNAVKLYQRLRVYPDETDLHKWLKAFINEHIPAAEAVEKLLTDWEAFNEINEA